MFFYVLDAKTGALISANNYVEVRWASGIDMKTGHPIPVAESRYDLTGKAVLVQPRTAGCPLVVSDVVQSADGARVFLGGREQPGHESH